MPLGDTTCVYGVEELDEGKCLAEYDVTPDSTIRLAKGGSASADGKKWEVDAGGYFRGGGASDIKVDYGASGIAPPSSKVIDPRSAAHVPAAVCLKVGQSGEMAKLKGAVGAIQVETHGR